MNYQTDKNKRSVRFTDGMTHNYGNTALSGGAEYVFNEPSGGGDRLVQGRKYTELLSGLGNIVDFSDGKMSVGGINVPYEYIDDDGQAWVKEGTLNKAIESARAISGTKRSSDIAADVNKKYSSAINKSLGKVTNRDAWGYEPKNDPAYRAYAEMYRRNAEAAYNRAIGSGGLYGSPTSYQMYQAIAGYGDNMQKLTDEVPQLARLDYERYSDEQDRSFKALEALRAERDAEMDALMRANDSDLDRLSKSAQRNYEHRRDALYNDPKEEQNLQLGDINLRLKDEELNRSLIDTAMYPAYAASKLRGEELEHNGAIIQNNADMLEYIMSIASERGYFTDDEAAFIGLRRDENGSYPPPWEARINAELAYWYGLTKPVAIEKQYLK